MTAQFAIVAVLLLLVIVPLVRLVLRSKASLPALDLDATQEVEAVSVPATTFEGQEYAISMWRQGASPLVVDDEVVWLTPARKERGVYHCVGSMMDKKGATNVWHEGFSVIGSGDSQIINTPVGEIIPQLGKIIHEGKAERAHIIWHGLYLGDTTPVQDTAPTAADYSLLS